MSILYFYNIMYYGLRNIFKRYILGYVPIPTDISMYNIFIYYIAI